MCCGNTTCEKCAEKTKKAEICEIFLQVAVYCGMPAGLGSFKAAKEVFKEMDI
jgi:alkylhydroperoxidase/carboxymuconolactone decarboxylase family protein YurZ